MDDCIKYLQKLSHKDEVRDNIIKRYLEGKSLSTREIEVITDKYINHKQAVKFFKEHKELNEFEKSLKQQFLTKGYLTPKQISALFTKKITKK